MYRTCMSSYLLLLDIFHQCITVGVCVYRLHTYFCGLLISSYKYLSDILFICSMSKSPYQNLSPVGRDLDQSIHQCLLKAQKSVWYMETLNKYLLKNQTQCICNCKRYRTFYHNYMLLFHKYKIFINIYEYLMDTFSYCI